MLRKIMSTCPQNFRIFFQEMNFLLIFKVPVSRKIRKNGKGRLGIGF